MSLKNFMSFVASEKNDQVSMTRVKFHEIINGEFFIARSVKDTWENKSKSDAILFLMVPLNCGRGCMRIDTYKLAPALWCSPVMDPEKIFGENSVIDTLWYFYKLETVLNTDIVDTFAKVGLRAVPSKSKQNMLLKNAPFKKGDIVTTTDTTCGFYYDKDNDVYIRGRKDISRNSTYTVDNVDVKLSTETRKFDTFIHLQEMADHIWVQASTVVMDEMDSLPEANKIAMLVNAITSHGHSFDICDDYIVYIKAFTNMHVLNPTDELWGTQVYDMDIIAKRISTNLIDGRVSIIVEYENTLFRVYIDDITITKAEHTESEFIYKLRTTGTLKYYTDNPVRRNFDLSNCHYFNSEFDKFTDDEIQVEVVDTKFAYRSEYNTETKAYESVKPTMFAAIRPKDPAYYGDISYSLFFNGKPIWVDYSILEAKLAGKKK